ncbi:MAG: HEAT repeat domain-containing protein [Planctomycetaceae bacterium]
MPDIHDWIRMYASQNRVVRFRAAQGLLDRANDIPLNLLVDILQNWSHEGLGAKAERSLLNRRDADLVPKMVSLLASADSFVQEVACGVLGHSGDYSATEHLLQMVDDPDMMVRRAAGFALAYLNDRSALPYLKSLYERHRNDDSNVVMALQCALKTLGESQLEKGEDGPND